MLRPSRIRVVRNQRMSATISEKITGTGIPITLAAGADVFIVGTSGLFNHAENIDEAWRIMTAQILAAKSEVQPHAKTA